MLRGSLLPENVRRTRVYRLIFKRMLRAWYICNQTCKEIKNEIKDMKVEIKNHSHSYMRDMKKEIKGKEEKWAEEKGELIEKMNDMKRKKTK